MVIKKWFAILGLTCWALTSCQSFSASPTSTIFISSTNTPLPTNTFLLTNTITPTSTIAPPTPTLIPPEVLTIYLENVHIVKTDSFDGNSNWGLNNEIAIISNGLLKLVGKGGEIWSGASYTKTFQNNEGLLINFKFNQGQNFEMYLDNGIWATGSYKRFGVYLNQGYADPNFFRGKEGIGGPNHLRGNLHPKPDVWYSLFMVNAKGGDFFAIIWDPANPEKVIKYRVTLDQWKELNWAFHIQINQGTVVFDDFYEIEFDSIK